MKSAVVIGSTGYGGAELIRQLLKHPEIKLKSVTSVDEIGKSVGDIHRSLYGATDLKFQEVPAAEAAQGADIVFLGLPHHVSFTVAPQLFESGVRLIDLSGDYRLSDPAEYETWYGAKHPKTGGVSSFVYGLPELFSETIKDAKRVASPGCFATAITLGLAPFAKAGKLSGKIRTVGFTGSSGSGAYPSATTHHPVRHNNMKSYKVLNHQHTPEIMQSLRMLGANQVQLDFVPVSAPTSRGILVTSLIDLSENTSSADVDKLMSSYYTNAPFIRLMGSSRVPETSPVLGTNFVEIGWSLDKRILDGKRTLAVTTALDNLVKGGAGQAIQSMNIMFGWGQTTGLTDLAPWPY